MIKPVRKAILSVAFALACPDLRDAVAPLLRSMVGTALAEE